MLPALTLAAIVWVSLLMATPFLHGSLSAVLYGLGSVICHQIPERSFHLAGFQLPVCARCLGLYVGVSIGAAGYACVGRVQGVSARVFGRSRRTRCVAAVAAAPTILTFGLEAAGVWVPSNMTRAVAGVPFGVVAALMVMSALATLHYVECVPPRPSVPKPPPRSL